MFEEETFLKQTVNGIVMKPVICEESLYFTAAPGVQVCERILFTESYPHDRKELDSLPDIADKNVNILGENN